jgi:hypothetical protein
VKIYLDGKDVDYTLENEKSIYDVIVSFEDWLKKSQMVITRLELDGKNYTYQAIKDDKTLSIDKISRMDIQAKHIHEVQLIRLNDALEYINKLVSSFEKDDLSGIENLLKGYPDFRSALKIIFGVHDETAQVLEISGLDKAFAGTTGGMVRSWKQENKQEALSTLLQVTTKLTLLKNELINPLITLTEVIGKLKTAKQDISNVSVLLQTGKDREAMQAIVNFSELTQSLLRIFSNIQFTKVLPNIQFKEKSFDRFYTDFNKNLHELISAFEKKDFVLIGDIFEYEITPSIEEIIEISEKITAKT